MVPGPLRRPKRVRGRVEKSALRLRGGEPQRGEHQEGQGVVGGCASARLAAAHTARRVQPFEAEARGRVLSPTAREEGSRRREALSARGKALKVKARERCWGETPSAGDRVARNGARVRGLRLASLQAVSLRSGSLRAPNAASGLPDRSWHLLSRMVGRSCLRVAEAGHAGDSGAASAEEHEKAQEGLLSDSGTHSCERVKGAGQAAGEVDGNAL